MAFPVLTSRKAGKPCVLLLNHAFILILTLASTAAFSQRFKVDSLEQKLLDLPQDTDRVKTLFRLCWENEYDHPEKALAYANTAQALSEKLHYKRGIAESYSSKGIVYSIHDSLAKSLDQLMKALAIYQEIGWKQREGNTYNIIGIVYTQRADFGKSLEYYLKSLKISEDLKEPGGIGYALNNIAKLYMENNDLPNAEAYFLKSIPYKVERKDNKGLCNAYLNLSRVYVKKKEMDKALEASQMALEKARLAKLKILEIQSTTQVGKVYDELGKFKEGEKFLNSALEISQAINIEHNITAAKMELGINYGLQGKIDAGLSLMEETIPSIALQNTDEVKHVYDHLIAMYVKKKDFRKAFLADVDYMELKDSLFTAEKEKQLAAVKTQYETEQKEHQIKMLNQDQALQQATLSERTTLIYLFVLLTISLVIVVSILYNRFRLKQKSNKALNERNAKIETLMRELHHRVKNNMQVISSLLSLQSLKMEEGTAREAVKEGHHRVEAMSLIHQQLYAGEKLTAINIKQYVEELVENLIESYKPKENKVGVQLNVPDIQIDVDTAIPLGLIINELVTNALKHAFSHTKTPELKLRIVEQDDINMKLTIEDNGVGISNFNMTQTKSFGLKLVSSLVGQLKGSLSVQTADGTRYDIALKHAPTLAA